MDKKEIKNQYKQSPPKMGVYKVENLANGKIFISSGLNVQGKINSIKFQLNHGSYPNRELQNDFNSSGESNFKFEIIDYLDPKDEPGYDHTSDLKVLELMWIEKLQPFGEKGYNKLL
jgi:hypothetical protein